jgi:hypothetical protein
LWLLTRAKRHLKPWDLQPRQAQGLSSGRAAQSERQIAAPSMLFCSVGNLRLFPVRCDWFSERPDKSGNESGLPSLVSVDEWTASVPTRHGLIFHVSN